MQLALKSNSWKRKVAEHISKLATGMNAVIVVKHTFLKCIQGELVASMPAKYGAHRMSIT